MVELLTRKSADVFCTWTFNTPHGRHDPDSVVEAVRCHLFKWEADQAEQRGLCRTKIKIREDGYGRELSTWAKRTGPFIKAWRRGEGLQYAIFVERHVKGDLHAHGLVWWGRYLGELLLWRAWELWHGGADVGGMRQGFGRFETPRSQEETVGYCAKYCLKPDYVLYLSDNLTLPGALWGAPRSA